MKNCNACNKKDGSCSVHIGYDSSKTTYSNNILIGLYAGIELLNDSDVIIIGDNIRNLKPNQKDVIYVTNKHLIGKTVFGKNNFIYEDIKNSTK